MNAIWAERQVKTLARLNDDFRLTGRGGFFAATKLVQSRGQPFINQTMRRIARARRLTPRKCSNQERAHGQLTVNGTKLCWVIEYLKFGQLGLPSSDPCDPEQTTRRLIVMLPFESANPYQAQLAGELELQGCQVHRMAN